jgi:hypothetical protein
MAQTHTCGGPLRFIVSMPTLPLRFIGGRFGLVATIASD